MPPQVIQVQPSPAYILFEQAMRERKQIVCMYEGYSRELCPIILGHSDGHEKALTYQFGGLSRSGLPREGEWRCLFLSKVRDTKLREGTWRGGTSHTRPQGCVKSVDLDVNPSSPYRPRRDDIGGAPTGHSAWITRHVAPAP